MTFTEADDIRFMRAALGEARAAAQLHDDVPVGAVLVGPDGSLLATGRNERERLRSPVAHAEIQALLAGAKSRGSWNLAGCSLYVTLEPCAMCAGALVLSRIEEVIYATSDPKGGVITLAIPILDNPSLNHRVRARQGPCAKEASVLLKDFFRKKRSRR